MTHDSSRSRLSRLTDAVDAYLDHRSKPDRDDDAFLAAHGDLRDLLEALMTDEDGDADLVDGERYLGDFRIVREIGRGGMGIVFEAVQESLGRRVALKVLPAHMTLSPAQIDRFRKEASAAAKLQHVGIVPIHAIGSVSGSHFFAMEYVDGQTLHRAIESYPEHQTFGILPNASRSAEAAEIARRIAEALAYSHDHGVIHRDVKPHNVLITTDGRVQICDFGLAKDDSSAAVSKSSGGGTPYYMSPEQIRTPESIDKRTDVFSLGTVLYEMLVGTRPFEGKTTEQVIVQVTSLDVKGVRSECADVPRDLETICLKALEKDRDQRYEDAHEFAADLQRFLRHEPIRAKPPATAVRLAKLVRRHRAVSAALALAFCVTIGAAIYISAQARAQRDRDRANAQHSKRAILSLIDVALSTTIPRRPGDERRCVARLERSTDVCEGLLAQLGPDASMELRRRFVDLLMFLGDFYLHRARESQAESIHGRAVQVARENLRAEPNSFLDIAKFAVSFTHLFQSRPKHARDLKELAEFDVLVARMQNMGPFEDESMEDMRLRAVASVLSWRGAMHLEARQPLDGIRRDLEAARDAWGQRRRTTMTALGSGWLMTNLHLANLTLVERNHKKALEILDDTSTELAPFLEDDPQNLVLRSEAAKLQALRARVHVALGEVEEAIASSKAAIGIRRKIAEDFPRSTEITRDLAAEYVELAKLHRALRQTEEATSAARAAVESIASVPDSPETANVRATARGLLAMILMHAVHGTTGIERAEEQVKHQIEENFEAALDDQHALTEAAPSSAEYAYAAASIACNFASWKLAVHEEDRALELAREAFDNGMRVKRARDPRLVGSNQNLRVQLHLLVTCLLRKSDARQAWNAIVAQIEQPPSSASDYVNAAIQACRVRSHVLARDARDVDTVEETRRMAEVAMSWLGASVDSDPRVLQKYRTHVSLKSLSDREDFGQLLEEAKRRIAGKQKSR
ncbi:MAG: serine/threonine protein kinase [Planctomycetes bacterium]|nr:serine/threonine protein kinase [Planctomycetota bacterium]